MCIQNTQLKSIPFMYTAVKILIFCNLIHKIVNNYSYYQIQQFDLLFLIFSFHSNSHENIFLKKFTYCLYLNFKTFVNT